MRRVVPIGLGVMLASVFLAGVAGSWGIGAKQENQGLARITDKIKTLCVGRFLLDMPEETQIDLRSASVGGFDISAFDESADDFQARLAQREAEIKAKPDRLGGTRNLELVKEVNTESGLVGKIFVHSRVVDEGTAGNGLEIERYRYEGIAVEALVHGEGVSIDVGSDFYFPEKVDDLYKLVTQLIPNPRNEIPREPGFCFDHAYIRDPLRADQGEQITMFANLPSHPDIDFLLILAAGIKPDDDGLLKRGAASEDRLSIVEKLRVTRLRSAPREIGGLSGEELIRRVAEENDTQGYSFRWEVNGTEDDVLTPHLVFRMRTGNSNDGPVPTSMSEDAALGLWDKISSSIRPRSTEPVVSRRVEAPTTPLGTYASAGERCPESGWWLCGDGGNGIGVLGGERQYIKKGDPMPQALLLPRRTLWDKMRGLQPSFEPKSPTFWKLVDKRVQKRVPPTLPLALPVSPPTTAIAGSGANVNAQTHVSVGSFAVTGTPCPASGWWRCEQSHALDGTRWFGQGALLPPATFAVPPGLFGGSANAPKSIQRRGEWRLVRLADSLEQADPDTQASYPG